MKIVNASYEILTQVDEHMLEDIERAARTCYKSEDKIAPESSKKLVARLIASGHEAMLEHASISIKFICDRGISHEIVRHRLAAFAQESTRYCNYSQGKFGGEITVIKPSYLIEGTEEYTIWELTCRQAEGSYLTLLNKGLTPQEARAVLPTCLKTEVVMTANLREWRHFFKLRAIGTTGIPHPQMLEITRPLLEELKNKLPVVFDDLDPDQPTVNQPTTCVVDRNSEEGRRLMKELMAALRTKKPCGGK